MAVEITDGTLKGKIISLLEYLNIIDSFPHIERGETANMNFPPRGTNIHISFTKAFKKEPTVLLSLIDGGSYFGDCALTATATSSSMTISVWNNNSSHTASGRVSWLAIE